ncbi:hypothetical protein D8770_25430 [Methylobacterium sp. DB1607]|nr:hypothetical protein [Methylobacterium sp. DB1607]
MAMKAWSAPLSIGTTLAPGTADAGETDRCRECRREGALFRERGKRGLHHSAAAMTTSTLQLVPSAAAGIRPVVPEATIGRRAQVFGFRDWPKRWWR